MKVFIGWSGETSHQVALALREWLPRVIQAVKPYVSSEDIAKGARWSTNIAGELQTSSYGIICVTRENSRSPWINFEAGALSKEIEKSFVSPFLFGLKTSDIEGPLAQFQAVLNDENDVTKLLSSINERQTPEQRLEKGDLKIAFNAWWPQLKEQLAKVEREQAHTSAPPKRENHEILEELLNLARIQRNDVGSMGDIVSHQLELLAKDQVSRTSELSSVVSALARSVESLHTEMSGRRVSIGDYTAAGRAASALTSLSSLGKMQPPPEPPSLLSLSALAGETPKIDSSLLSSLAGQKQDKKK